MRIFVGLAIADSMFPAECSVRRRPCPPPLAMKLLGAPTEPDDDSEVVNACNRSHTATLAALKERYGIDLTVGLAETPPRVSLGAGDLFIVLSVRGLPRLTDRREYTPAEIAGASFDFGLWEV